MQVRTSQEHNAKAHDTSSATPTRMSRIVPRATFRQIGKKRMPIETGTKVVLEPGDDVRHDEQQRTPLLLPRLTLSSKVRNG